MNICEKCGSSVSGNFCTNCGTMVVKKENNYEQPNNIGKNINISISNIEMIKIVARAICWLSMSVLILLVVFVPCYDFEYQKDYWEEYENEWTMFDWNKMIIEDIGEMTKEMRSYFKNYKSSSSEYKQLNSDEYGEIRTIYNKISVIYAVNLCMCIAVVGIMGYAIYVYVTKTEDHERAWFVTAGETASYAVAVAVVINYIFMRVIKDIGIEKYGDDFTMDAHGGAIVILIWAIINAKVVLGFYNKILYRVTMQDSVNMGVTNIKANNNLESKLEIWYADEQKSKNNVKNSWTCSNCGCVNADYVGSCKCGQSKYNN